MVKSCLRTSKMQKLQKLFSKRQCNYRHTITNSLQHMNAFPTTQTNEQLEASIAWTISKLGLLLKTQNWVCHVQISLSLSLSRPPTITTSTFETHNQSQTTTHNHSRNQINHLYHNKIISTQKTTKEKKKKRPMK